MKRTYSSVTYFEQQIVTLYGPNSNAITSLDLVREKMNAENNFKRDDGSDYYTHCVDVANTLISYRIVNQDVVCAALLHDIIEDVPDYTQETIAQLTNANVARLVMMVTKTPGVDYHDSDNLKAYIDNIKTDADAAAIKTADRMHNMLTLQNKTPEARYRKIMETKTYYIPFFHDCRKMYPRYQNLFYAAKAQTLSQYYSIHPLHEENIELKKQIAKMKEEMEVMQAKLDDLMASRP